MATTGGAEVYYPITIARSDGVGYTRSNNDHIALSPNEEQDVLQLERWEVIIGGHLAAQLAPKHDSKCPSCFVSLTLPHPAHFSQYGSLY